MTYSKKEIKKALAMYQRTKSVELTVKKIGYPSISLLYKWIKDEDDYNIRQHRNFKHANIEIKRIAIKDYLVFNKSIKTIAQEVGYSEVTIYNWIKQSDNLRYNSDMSNKNKTNKTNKDEEMKNLYDKIDQMQLQIDILNEALNIIKKDPSINLNQLSNKEKTVMIDALKGKYSLSLLLKTLRMAKSSYYYHQEINARKDKYSELRLQLATIFKDNYEAYGYRRLHAYLKNRNITVSEKVIRRLMKEEQLIVRVKRKGKYNSYSGEITPAVDNIIQQNFHADKPNEKWLTDITMFSIQAGKIYLSPIIDCFDGSPVVWTIGTSPNAELANNMLLKAVKTLKPGEKPILHSDRGCHYRWPEWIAIEEKFNIIRSMSKKGCSPDNSACEGFFGRLKLEMFYGKDWSNCSVKQFIQILNEYLVWFKEKRIKSALNDLTPVEYRRKEGFAV